MKIDCSVVELTPSSRVIVKKESVETLVLLQDRLKLDPEWPEARLHPKRDVEVESASNITRVTENSGTEVAKEEASKVDTSDGELDFSSTECSSDTDESCPPSPASKSTALAQLNINFELDHCLYFRWGTRYYCWGFYVGSRFESCVCEVHGIGADGKPMLGIAAQISTTGGGPSYNWGGLWFLHPNRQQRTICYQPTAEDEYQNISTYPEFRDLVTDVSTAALNGSGNNDLLFQDVEQPDFEGIPSMNNMPQQHWATPAGSSQASYPGGLGDQPQEPPSANTEIYPFSASTNDGATRITLVNRDGVTLKAINDFVNEHWPRNRRKKPNEQIVCHICPVSEHDKPRRDVRPYALKEHLKSHFFKGMYPERETHGDANVLKAQCMWCIQAYSNKANLNKNHPECGDKPAGVPAGTKRYKYISWN